MTQTDYDPVAHAAAIKAKMEAGRYRFTATGHTYPHRLTLMACGFWWNHHDKVWVTIDGQMKPTDPLIERAAGLEGVKVEAERLE
jgi:mannose-6-phosphate isomerase-like protein (cupin superfamily)